MHMLISSNFSYYPDEVIICNSFNILNAHYSFCFLFQKKYLYMARMLVTNTLQTRSQRCVHITCCQFQQKPPDCVILSHSLQSTAVTTMNLLDCMEIKIILFRRKLMMGVVLVHRHVGNAIWLMPFQILL